MTKPLRVLNRHSMLDADRPNAMYVGRGSPWGNPFKIGEHGNRVQCIQLFEIEILPTLDLTALRGKDLICYCAPLMCHADVLLREANK